MKPEDIISILEDEIEGGLFEHLRLSDKAPEYKSHLYIETTEGDSFVLVVRKVK